MKLITEHYFDDHENEDRPHVLRGMTWGDIQDIAKIGFVGICRVYYTNSRGYDLLMFCDAKSKKSKYTINLTYISPTKASPIQNQIPQTLRSRILSTRNNYRVETKEEQENMFVDDPEEEVVELTPEEDPQVFEKDKNGNMVYSADKLLELTKPIEKECPKKNDEFIKDENGDWYWNPDRLMESVKKPHPPPEFYGYTNDDIKMMEANGTIGQAQRECMLKSLYGI